MGVGFISPTVIAEFVGDPVLLLVVFFLEMLGGLVCGLLEASGSVGVVGLTELELGGFETQGFFVFGYFEFKACSFVLVLGSGY